MYSFFMLFFFDKKKILLKLVDFDFIEWNFFNL